MTIERILDRYDVEQRLGAGGMGDVWAAHDTLLGRRVAIKFVGEKELRENPGADAILRDEAKHAGQLLGHPQVVSVLDLVTVDTALHQGPAIVLEYVEGCNVGEWISQYRGQLDNYTRLQTGLFIGLETIEALHFAHKRQILHRDVKPQNVLLSVDGAVKVSDFGLSRVVEEITRTHTVWGRHTPLYAAPEQWADEKPDEDTDIYQLAATLYHLLAGVPANTGTHLMGLMRWHESETPEPLRDHVKAISAPVAEVIHDGLLKERAERPTLWRMFDAFSNALVKTNVRLTAAVDVNEDGSHELLARELAAFTDFDQESLVSKGEGGATFPHAQEAIQEAIGVTLRGGRAKLHAPARAASSRTSAAAAESSA